MAGKLLTDNDLRRIVQNAVKRMEAIEAFVHVDLAVDQKGKASNVFDDEAVARSADGWILKEAYDLLDSWRRQAAAKALEDINKLILRNTGLTLVTISDDMGRIRAIEALQSVLCSLVPRQK